MTKRISLAALALGFALRLNDASAQLPSASTAALGLADNYTAAARGYHAIAWNPALLGLSGNPGTSLALVPFRLVAGLDPVTFSDIKAYEGQVVPLSVRQQWLAAIQAEGTEEGTGGADVTYVAAQIGRFGLQVSSTLRAIAELSPGVAQLVLLGSTDQNGQPQDIEIGAGELNTSATSTVAASYAIPIRSTTGNMSFGATLKYTVGHVLMYGRQGTSQVTAAPVIDVRFPVVGTLHEDDAENDLNNGSGIGLDVGFAMQRNQLTVSATVQNIFNSFKWKTDDLVFRPGTFIFDADTHDADFDEQSFNAAPADLRETVEDLKYRPTVAAGIALQLTDRFLLAADARTRLGDNGLREATDFHAGAGAEYRLASFLPIRGGVALIDGGFQISGGAGVTLGPFTLAASVMRRNGDLGSDIVTMLTLISTGR
jgi:hypothetical protein